MHFRNIFLITWLGVIVILTTEVIGCTLGRYAVDSLSTCITAILMYFLFCSVLPGCKSRVFNGVQIFYHLIYRLSWSLGNSVACGDPQVPIPSPSFSTFGLPPWMLKVEGCTLRPFRQFRCNVAHLAGLKVSPQSLAASPATDRVS